jgi:hypothetical protein
MTDFELELSVKEEKYSRTISELRTRNFKNNLPFTILSDELPEGQAFREFADGHIEIQEVFSIGSEFKSKHIKTLTPLEAERVRRENGLL